MTDENTNTEQKIDEFIEGANTFANQAVSDLYELGAIFKAIKGLAGEYSDISRLASAGEYLASDKANANDVWWRDLVDDFKDGR